MYCDASYFSKTLGLLYYVVFTKTLNKVEITIFIETYQREINEDLIWNLH